MATAKTLIEIVVEAKVKQLLKAMGVSKEAIEKLAGSTKKVDKSFGDLDKRLKQVFSAIVIKQAAQMGAELVKLSAGVKDLQNAFSKLPDSSNLIVQLKDAVKGTIPEFELMRAALQGIDLGGTNKQLVTFAKFARLESLRKGTDTLLVFQQVLSGAFRGSTELFDNFGFSIADVRIRVEELSKAMGRNVNTLGEAERRTIQVQALYTMMNERIAKNAILVTTDSEKIRQMETAWKEVQVRIGQFLSGVGMNLVAFFTDSIGLLNDFFDLIGVGGARRIRELADGFGALQKSTTGQEKELNRLMIRYQKLLPVAEGNRKVQDELQKVMKDIVAIVPDANKGFDEYNKILGINTTTVDRFLAVQRALLKRTEVKVFNDVTDAIRDNIFQRKRQNKIIKDSNEELDRLSKKKPGDIVGGLAGTGNTVILQKASERIKELDKTIADSTETVKKAVPEFDELVLAVSNFVDFKKDAPEKISEELKISAANAQVLIDRFKELSKITPTPKKGTPTDKEEVLRQKRIAKLMRDIRLEQAIRGAKDEFEARVIKLEDMRIRELEIVSLTAKQRKEIEGKSSIERAEIEGKSAKLREKIEQNHQERIAKLKEEFAKKTSDTIHELLIERAKLLAADETEIAIIALEAQLEKDKELHKNNKDALKLLEQNFQLDLQNILDEAREREKQKRLEDMQSLIQLMQQAGSIIENAFVNLADSLADSATKGSEAWKGFFDDLKKQIISFLISKAVTSLLNFLASFLPGGGGGGLFGSGLGILGTIFKSATGSGSGDGAGSMMGGIGAGGLTFGGGSNFTPAPLPNLTAPPPPTPAGGGSSFGGGNIVNNFTQGPAPTSKIVVEVQTPAPDLTTVRAYYKGVNRSILIPDTDQANQFNRTKKSEFD